MKVDILLTGSSGRLGGRVAEALLKTGNFNLRLLLRDKPTNRALADRLALLYKDKVEVMFGDVTSETDCKNAIEGVKYVLHFAGIMPPKSSHYPDICERTNYFGTKNLVDAIIQNGKKDEIRFVEMGSVTEYGNRNYLHPWTRLGDPLIPSYFDCYALSKLRAERYIVESGLKYFVALRVVGILHDDIVKDNLQDGLFLQTPPNAPVQFVLSDDLVEMFKNLLLFDKNGTLPYKFWRRIYNIGGGEDSRFTGYELFQKGLALFSMCTDKVIKPKWLPFRNYFTSWYIDSDDINGYLKVKYSSVDNFFNKLYDNHLIYHFAKPFSQVAKKYIETKIVDSTNSPYYWVDNGMTDRVEAFYYSYNDFKNIPSNFKDYPLLINNKAYDVNNGVVDVNYNELRDIANSSKYLLDHGFNDKKDDEDITADDLRQAAEYRGGKCLSSIDRGDVHTLLNWRCSHGHNFKATAYGVLRCGYWCNECCTPVPWNFDSVAKSSPYFAQVWYDSHRKSEEVILGAECYHDIPREDKRDKKLKGDKIIKYKKG